MKTYCHIFEKDTPPLAVRLRRMSYLRSRSGLTLVLDLPQDHDWWIAQIVHLVQGGELVLPMGYSKVHPKDQFCRKTGREQADLRIVDTSLKLQYVSMTASGRTQICLHSDRYTFIVSIKCGTRPQLCDAEVYYHD